MFEIKINGFKTKEHAESFWHWYSGSGEQHFDLQDEDGKWIGYNTNVNDEGKFMSWKENTLLCSLMKVDLN